MRIEQDVRKVKKKALFNLCIRRLDFFYHAHYVSLYNLSFKIKLETGAKLVSVYNAYLPHDLLVYPPKIYFSTLIIVIFHFQFGAQNSQLTDHDILWPGITTF